jgi:two-component system, chemotaxis family, protein-glutamate methylesterase/glutaminase
MQELDVIVIGGSSGALEALLEILPALPDELAIPIVVAIHLLPTQPSLVPGLLARVCGRPVCEAEDKLAMQPRTIYVAPPNYHVLLERDATLSLSVDAPVHFSRPSIDVLFESAADSAGPSAAGVILSGSSEDGAHGLWQIHRAGGVAIVQDPASAPHPVMPAAALRWVGPQARVLAASQLAGCLATLGGAIPPHQEPVP